MPAKWAPREGQPWDIAHWDAIRAQPGFSEGWKNIQVQPTAAEQIGALKRRIAELEAELKNVRLVR